MFQITMPHIFFLLRLFRIDYTQVAVSNLIKLREVRAFCNREFGCDAC